MDADDIPGRSTDDPTLGPTASGGESFRKRWDVTKMDKSLQELLGDKGQYIERARIYFRWTHNTRPLVVPSFITKNAAIYKNLNIILSHVIPLFDSFSDGQGCYVGSRPQNHRRQMQKR